MSQLQKPSIGRIVHYVMPDKQHRPAIIVRVWGDSDSAAVQLQVFTDGRNDESENVIWKTSVTQDVSEDPQFGTFHFPERI